MNEKCKTFIIDHHRILREGIRALLSAGNEFEVIGETEDGRMAVIQVGKLRPDIVLLEISLVGLSGIDVLRKLSQRHPETRVLILTDHKNQEYVLEALEAGARGYMLKNASREELISAMRHVMGGKIYLSPDIQGRVVAAYLSGGRSAMPASPWGTLTHRERQTLKLIAEGHSTKAIAAYLNISAKTVAKHRANLMRKLSLHNASALTAFAIKQGLLD